MSISIGPIKIKPPEIMRRLTSEITLPEEHKVLFQRLYSKNEPEQMEAAMDFGNVHDIRLLAMLQFSLKDDVLDEVLAHATANNYQVAQKQSVRLFSLMAASHMIDNSDFFSKTIGAILSNTESSEERCDLIYVMACLFEEFGHNIHMRDGTFVSQKIGGEFVNALLAIISTQTQPDEVRVAAAVGIKKTIQNANISMKFTPQT
ncbi:MAG TPA: hypothetical protein PLO51_05865, partial [Candidatus Micrarchaeota archaeon]|nr:hypothetical protein [Candidatus Micrarchaeota archaeon]